MKLNWPYSSWEKDLIIKREIKNEIDALKPFSIVRKERLKILFN